MKFIYLLNLTLTFRIKFLIETVVYKTPTGKLETKLYTKDTDRQSYLHLKPEHRESLKHSIPFEQPLRLRRTCTADKEFQLNCNELRKG